MKLSAIMKNARKTKGFRLEQVKRATGISMSMINRIEMDRLIHAKVKLLEVLIAFYEIDRDSTFLAAERIPPEVFYKIIRCPALLQVIREYPE